MSKENTTNGHTETDGFDLKVFQAEIDSSVASVRSLVQSWVPDNLDSSWDVKESTKSQLLAQKARPPRIGLGANVTMAHQQHSEDLKLRNQLLRSGKRGTKQDESEKMAAAAAEEDDDEEESRSTAISKPSHGFITHRNPFILPKPIEIKQEPPISTPSTPTDPTKLTKNKRKKLRQKEQAEAIKRAKMEEVTREMEASGEIDVAPTLLEQIPEKNFITQLPKQAQEQPQDEPAGEHDSEAESEKDTHATDGGKKKKKRRRKSKGGQKTLNTPTEPVLNLTPLER